LDTNNSATSFGTSTNLLFPISQKASNQKLKELKDLNCP